MDASGISEASVLAGLHSEWSRLSLNGFPKKKVHMAVRGCPPPLCRAERKGEAEGKICER